MIRLNNAIRLTQQDKRRISGLTGTTPNHVRTVAELNSFIESHLPMMGGLTPEEKLITLLLKDEIIKN